MSCLRWLWAAANPRHKSQQLPYFRIIAAQTDGPSPANWLSGCDMEASKSQRAASAATPQEERWTAGTAPVLDLQGAGIRGAHARRWTTFGVIWGSIVLRGQVISDCT